MPNRKYLKGRKYEYDVMDIFKEKGYTVTRAAASHSPFDVIATKITKKYTYEVWVVVLCQCKKKKR